MKIHSWICLLLTMVFILSSCGNVKKPSDPGITDPPETTGSASTDETTADQNPWAEYFLLYSPEDGVSIHTKVMKNYLADSVESISKYAVLKEIQDVPRPVSFKWFDAFSESEEDFDHYRLEISESPDFSDPKILTSTANNVDVYNLKIGTTYWWRVTSVCKNDSYTSDPVHFTTSSAAPRALYIEGVSNARDIGGWATENGGSVRQGLFYRLGRLTEDYTGDQRVTDDGLQTLRKLGIRTEIDLRSISNNEYGGLTESILDGCWYCCYPLKEDENAVRTIFGMLADESYYPVMIHCSVGIDRTG